MGRPLDEVDLKILDLLEINGRETISALAGEIGLSRSALQERITRLEKNGEIAGYTIKRKTPAADKLMRAYLLVKTNGALCHEIAPYLEKWPEVKFFDSISGDVDALICVETKTPIELGELRDKLAAFHQVADIENQNPLAIGIKKPAGIIQAGF